MTEVEKAILEIRENLARINSKLESIGPRIGEASLCKYHSEQIEKLASRIYIWSGGLSVLAFTLGILIPVLVRYLKL